LLPSLALLAVFALVPPAMLWLDEPFYIDLGARIVIFALAALSLDLILGYGGMVSFGHAAYLGIGAYTVGILSHYGIQSAFIHLPLAVGASAAVALAIGAISLRTSGVYFIMITLAFTQMLYFFAISLEEFGGDDGLPLKRSELFGPFDLNDSVQFYYFALAVLAAALLAGRRLVSSRFGLAIRGARSNERRMRAIGFPTYRYKLAAFVLAGAVCGLAGALLGNLTDYTSPNYMHWTRSGELIIMVIMGGMGTLIGPVLGASAYLLLEEYLPEWLDGIAFGWGAHWQVALGPILILIVLFGRGGLMSLAAIRGRR
jgi:branched-chain amino acid transport system permease protein